TVIIFAIDAVGSGTCAFSSNRIRLVAGSTTMAAEYPLPVVLTDAPVAVAGPSSCCCPSSGIAKRKITSRAKRLFIMGSRIWISNAVANSSNLRALLSGSRRAGNGADHRPVVFVHDHRTFGLRPQLDGEVVIPVAEDARFDGEVAHALAQTLFSSN